MKSIVITGANGLLGWHSAVRLHAENCASWFKERKYIYKIILLDRNKFQNSDCLHAAVENADIILHFAGVNKANNKDEISGNINIAQKLAFAYKEKKSKAHIVYANSTHSLGKSEYGLSKESANQVLGNVAFNYTNLILPHIFGECARPYYNNVTATLIDQIWENQKLTVNPGGYVSLFHAGDAAEAACKAGLNNYQGNMTCNGRNMSITELAKKLESLHFGYKNNIFPDLKEPFQLKLFNAYRNASFPSKWPLKIKLNKDSRGQLFEAAKGGGGGQSFVSSTHPGITRGNHFHLKKVERFLVIKGNAIIRIRRVLDDKVFKFKVSGDSPACLDIPTLHTHSIENIGDGELTTLFWSSDIFDPEVPDTYADPVLI
tara:strand:- start:5517 stop:6641 length:1125 start_codon:yes stop_codon:yes gene_type:complete